MNSLNLSQVTHVTKCKLMRGATGVKPFKPEPCPFSVTDHPMNVEIIGQPHARVQRFIGSLMEHLQKKHPEAMAIMQKTAQEFWGWLVLTSFDSPDPHIIEARNHITDGLRRMVCGPPVTDDQIDIVIGQLPLTKEDPAREQARFALRNLRDYYEGKLPLQQQNSPEKR